MSRRHRQEASRPCMHLACSRASEQSCDRWTGLSIRWVGRRRRRPHHERHGDVRRRRPPGEKTDRSRRVHVSGGDGSDGSGGDGRRREMNRVDMYVWEKCLLTWRREGTIRSTTQLVDKIWTTKNHSDFFRNIYYRERKVAL